MTEDGWITPDPAAVSLALAEAGCYAVESADVVFVAREDRLAARLPGDRMAWFPMNAKGLGRLRRERRVLELIARHCQFAAPRVLYEAPAGWDLRALVGGYSEPFAVYDRVKAEPAFARALGASMGRILADQHAAIPAEALAGWLPPTPDWPPPIAFAAARLPQVTPDAALIDRALALCRAYESAESRVTERVLAHADFGFHNMVVDDAGQVVGVFDYDGAAFADRHHDFKLLLLDDADETLLDSAMAAYEAAGGAPLDRRRLYLLNAASAVNFLALRAGHGADERPAGRTLAEDLRWTQLALHKVGM